MKSTLRFVICTRDSAPWIGQFLDAYRKVGIEPLYIHDARSSDDTRVVLERAGAEVIDYVPSADFVEAGMIEFGGRHAEADWVFRIDDDEFPSRALIRWIESVGIRSRGLAFACSRREVFRSEGTYVYSRHPNRFVNPEAPHYLGRHVRLFRPPMVRYFRRLHSAGFSEPALIDFASQEAFFIHCNCLVRSVDQRLAKLRRYDRISPLSSWRCADEYVPELFDLSGRSDCDGLEEFEPLFATLSAPPEPDGPSLLPGEMSLIESEVAREQQTIYERACEYERRMARQKARYGEPVGHGRNRYVSTLASPIDFSYPGLPAFLEGIIGLSHGESWGRWTDGPELVLVFDRALPDRFTLKLVARPFGPNIDRDIAVTVGRFTSSMRFTEPGAAQRRIDVRDHGGTDTIRFAIPEPTAPSSLGCSQDDRLLGIGITSLAVEQERGFDRLLCLGRELLMPSARPRGRHRP